MSIFRVLFCWLFPVGDRFREGGIVDFEVDGGFIFLF
jgi:hypothetical protein